MQIEIDIPDEEYKRWREVGEMDALIVRNSLVNGIPHETVTEFADRCRECGREKVLKKICREIMKLQTYKMYEGEDTFYVELEDVLQIIDKYKALEQEPKTDTWSIKDVANTFKKHGLIVEQETCEDCISRQEAIDTIESWLSCVDYNEAERHIMRAMQSVLYDLPFVNPQEPKWIPVSERMPERNVEVLVTTEWDCITIGEMYSANDWFIHEGTTNAETDEIVAWMPLPEPYRAESEA